MAKIILLGQTSISLLLFRLDLLRELQSRGHDVTAVATTPGMEARFADEGIRYRSFPMNPTGLNPLTDLLALGKLVRLIRSERPDIVFAYGVKPVIYGCLAARFAGVRKITAMITGLGSALIGTSQKERMLAWVVRSLYRVSLRFARQVIFQNPDNRDYFIKFGLVRDEQTALVNGSGVNLEHFAAVPVSMSPFIFLMIARVLKDKGVAEYVAAAQLIRTEYPDVRCQLLGPFYDNPAAISPERVKEWTDAGIIDYLGEVEDVRPALAACSVYVLPSYMEGTPRSVLEAMAVGRAIITTDVPGCRQTVREGWNGFLVSPRDPAALADAMRKFVLDKFLAQQMGPRSRAFAEETFNVQKVNQAIIQALDP